MARQFLTDFELLILLAILRNRDDAYGVVIAREIESRAGRTVLLGAIYAALERLERNALIVSSIGEATAERGGRAKRYYRLTARGIRAVRDTQQAFVSMWTGIAELERSRI